MTSNRQSRNIINHIISQLSSGTNIVINKKKDNLLSFLTQAQKKSWRTSKHGQTSKHLVRYMRAQGLVELKGQPAGKYKLQITNAGLKRANKIDLDQISIPRPKSWDRKWRLVFFNIPETKRRDRNRLVAKLKDLGFYQLQRSLWVHPFPCSIEIEYIKRAYGLKNYVHMAEIINTSKHQQLLKHFRGLARRRRIS